MKIENKFKELLMPLSKENLTGLESDIVKNGCLAPLIVWEEQDTLLDGHNRLEICTRHGIAYEVKAVSFAGFQEAYNWIIDNQLSRRNVSLQEASYLRGKRYNAEKKAVSNPEGKNQYDEVGLHSATQPKTSEKIAEELNVNSGTIYRDAKYAEAIDKLETDNPGIKAELLNKDTKVTKKDVVKIAKLAPDKAKSVVEKIAAGEVKSASDFEKKKPHITKSTGDNEWYTPEKYIESARKVLGVIDIDPASITQANETVKAKLFYSIETDGLKHSWHGKAWLNPPYEARLIDKFCQKLKSEWNKENLSEAIVLVNNATETKWFNTLIDCASAVVFPNQRINFITNDGKKGAPLQGQAFIYIGIREKTFMAEFRQYGWGALL